MNNIKLLGQIADALGPIAIMLVTALLGGATLLAAG